MGKEGKGWGMTVSDLMNEADRPEPLGDSENDKESEKTSEKRHTQGLINRAKRGKAETRKAEAHTHTQLGENSDYDMICEEFEAS